MNRMLCVVLASAVCASLTYGDDPTRAELATTQPSKDFVADYIHAEKKGYISRPCGFDTNRNGVLGEPGDRLVGDGKTKDPDGDGIEEDILYVDAKAGSDEAGDGSPAKPYKTVQKALDAADGAADGAEDIICISGVFREKLAIKRSGVAGHYLRDNFQFPKNPTMLIGWDKDGDDEYPPCDKDDIAVLDGNVGPSNLAIGIRTDGKLSNIEIAHLTIRNYGGLYTEAGALKLFHWGTGLQSHIYVHDVEMRAINRAIKDASARIVCNFWGGPFTDVAIINNLVDEYASYFCRGAPPAGAGRIRFQNLTLKMFGTSGEGHVTGWKLWGRHNGVEILDTIVNCNAHAWKPVGAVSGIGICQGAQDWVVRGNVLIDVGVRLQPHAKGYYQGRPLNNILIDRNVFQSTYTGWNGAPMAIHVQGYPGADANETVQNATITNNFMYTTVGWGGGVRCAAGNGGGPQKGTIRIAGNTICGPFFYKSIWGPRNGRGISILPSASMVHKQNDYVIENNIIANTVEGDKNIETDYAPSNLISRGNVYAPGARFRWNETKHWVTMSFSEWKAATGQDADSKTGRPAFVDAAGGDFHLRPEDTVAQGAGVDITKTTKTDFDGHPRSSTHLVAGADVPGSKTTKRPLEATVKRD